MEGAYHIFCQKSTKILYKIAKNDKTDYFTYESSTKNPDWQAQSGFEKIDKEEITSIQL